MTQARQINCTQLHGEVVATRAVFGVYRDLDGHRAHWTVSRRLTSTRPGQRAGEPSLRDRLTIRHSRRPIVTADPVMVPPAGASQGTRDGRIGCGAGPTLDVAASRGTAVPSGLWVCVVYRRSLARLLAAMCCSMVARGSRGMVLSG